MMMTPLTMTMTITITMMMVKDCLACFGVLMEDGKIVFEVCLGMEKRVS